MTQVGSDRERERDERLRASEEALLEAQAIAHVGSWEWSIADDRVAWSAEMYRIYGLRPDEFDASYEAFLARVHPDDREAVVETIRAARNGDRSFAFEHRILRPHGEERTLHVRGRVEVDETGEAVRMRGTAQDVSERRQAEAQLRAVFEYSPDAVVLADEQGTIMLVNARAEELFGWSREELVGGRVEQLLPERFAVPHVEHRSGYSDAPRVRPMGIGLDLYGRRRDGTEFPVAISLGPLTLEGRRLVLATIRDISERLTAEETARRLEEMTRRRQDALELNDSIVQGLAEARLALQLDRQTQALEAVERTLRAAQRIIGELLTEVKESGEIGPGDLVRSQPAGEPGG